LFGEDHNTSIIFCFQTSKPVMQTVPVLIADVYIYIYIYTGYPKHLYPKFNDYGDIGQRNLKL